MVQLTGSYQEDYPYLSDAPARWSSAGDKTPTHDGLQYLFKVLANNTSTNTAAAAAGKAEYRVPPTGMRSSTVDDVAEK